MGIRKEKVPLQPPLPSNVLWGPDPVRTIPSVYSTTTCVTEKQTARMDQMRRNVKRHVMQVTWTYMGIQPGQCFE